MIHRIGRHALVVVAVVGFAARAEAEVKVDALIGNHMVVQRDRPVKLSGSAAAGEEVHANLGAAKATAKADANGRWAMVLPALAAGGPFTLRIRGTNVLTFTDVWAGEVWVASGQSNMEFPLQRSKGGADAAWQDETNATIIHKGNVMYELHGWSPKYYPDSLKYEISHRLKDRILFGADFPMLKYERLVDDWRKLGYSQEILEKVFFRNAERYLETLGLRA